MDNIKVGDKLIRTSKGLTGRHRVGSVGIVSHINGGCVCFEGIDDYTFAVRNYKLYKEPEMNETKKPHIHAECIKAWADGATIEYQIYLDHWIDCKSPSWCEDYEYRIKPEPKPDVVKEVGAVLTDHNISGVGIGLYNPLNLKLTFDGETGKLKKAEVIG